jgi:hypothetical protein
MTKMKKFAGGTKCRVCGKINVIESHECDAPMAAERIFMLEVRERQLIAANTNGCMDTALYILRKELDTLKRQ